MTYSIVSSTLSLNAYSTSLNGLSNALSQSTNTKYTICIIVNINTNIIFSSLKRELVESKSAKIVRKGNTLSIKYYALIKMEFFQYRK
jgi:hypothetical protein